MDWLMGKTKRKDARNGEDERPYLLDDVARQRLTDVDLERVVDLPPDLDLDEWLATHTIKFYEHINYLYGAISDYCSCDKCGSMTAPNDVVYQWLDDKGKKVKVTAAQYIEYVTAFTQKTICDESVFPTKYGNVFPSSFDAVIRKVWRLLFHVLAHLYHAHFKHVLAFNLQAFINTVTLHFLLFARRFSLLDAAASRDLDVLDDLYHKLRSVSARVIGKDDSRSSLSSSSSSSVRGGDATAAARVGGAAADSSSQTSLSPSAHDSPLTSLATSPGSSSTAPLVAQRLATTGDGDAGGGVTSQRASGGGGSQQHKSGSLASSLPESGSSPHLARHRHVTNDAAAAAATSLSSSPVLTTQPNGHARRTPST